MKTGCREYQQNDIKQLQKLMFWLGYSIEIPDLQENIKAIYKKGGVVLIFEKDKNVVGSICVLIDARLAEGIYGEIVSLIVSEESRGHGIGKELVKQAEAWAVKHVNKIRVRANEIRDSAHSFYEDQGYKEVKTQKIFIKNL